MRLSSYADKDDARCATESEEEVFVSGSPPHRQTMQRAFFDVVNQVVVHRFGI